MAVVATKPIPVSPIESLRARVAELEAQRDGLRDRLEKVKADFRQIDGTNPDSAVERIVRGVQQRIAAQDLLSGVEGQIADARRELWWALRKEEAAALSGLSPEFDRAYRHVLDQADALASALDALKERAAEASRLHASRPTLLGVAEVSHFANLWRARWQGRPQPAPVVLHQRATDREAAVEEAEAELARAQERLARWREYDESPARVLRRNLYGEPVEFGGKDNVAPQIDQAEGWIEFARERLDIARRLLSEEQSSAQ